MKRFIFLLVFVLAACAPKPPGVVLPELLPSATAYLDPSYPTAQVMIATPNQIASGVEVVVDRVWQDGKDLNANVCFTLPDSSNWSLWDVTLNYAGMTLDQYGTMLSSMQEPANGQPGRRCDTLTFQIAPDADLTNASIVVNAIGSRPVGDEYCTVYLPKIQQAMTERGTGIVVNCVDVGGVMTMQIASFPPEMTQQQAEQVVYSDEFYTIKGPWVFTFSLTP